MTVGPGPRARAGLGGPRPGGLAVWHRPGDRLDRLHLGKAAGSASPLTWAQAQYARLAIDLSSGRNLETPDIVTDRYVTHGMPGSLPVTITSPAPGSNASSATITVTGTTTAGATVDAEAVGSAGGTAATATTKADSSGNWTLPIAPASATR